MSQGSMLSLGLASEMNFVPSITDPPPTASKKSTCFFRTLLMALSSVA